MVSLHVHVKYSLKKIYTRFDSALGGHGKCNIEETLSKVDFGVCVMVSGACGVVACACKRQLKKTLCSP